MSETVRSVLPSLRRSIASLHVYRHSITAVSRNGQKVLKDHTWHCHGRSSNRVQQGRPRGGRVATDDVPTLHGSDIGAAGLTRTREGAAGQWISGISSAIATVRVFQAIGA